MDVIPMAIQPVAPADAGFESALQM
jgi:hypothetical protein